MRRLPILLSGAALAVMASGLAVAQPPTARATPCGRHCLLAILWDYTEALTDNKPSDVPAAADVRVTSNGRQVELGRGAAWGSPRRIIEEVAYEGSSMGANAKTLSLPDRVFDALLPPDEQSSHRELIRIANEYFDAVSGKLDYRKVPWHPECQRIELGVFTVNAASSPGSCGGEFQNPAVRWNVVNRRFYVTDVQRGIVLAIANFTTPPDLPHNNGSVVFELFKIQDGFIRQIQAFFRGNGQLHSGWGAGPGS